MCIVTGLYKETSRVAHKHQVCRGHSGGKNCWVLKLPISWDERCLEQCIVSTAESACLCECTLGTVQITETPIPRMYYNNTKHYHCSRMITSSTEPSSIIDWFSMESEIFNSSWYSLEGSPTARFKTSQLSRHFSMILLNVIFEQHLPHEDHWGHSCAL